MPELHEFIKTKPDTDLILEMMSHNKDYTGIPNLLKIMINEISELKEKVNILREQLNELKLK